MFIVKCVLYYIFFFATGWTHSYFILATVHVVVFSFSFELIVTANRQEEAAASAVWVLSFLQQ